MLVRSLHEVARAKKTASRLLFALGWHLIPQESDFFWEIFKFKKFSFVEGIIVQGLKPSRKVKAGLAPAAIALGLLHIHCIRACITVLWLLY